MGVHSKPKNHRFVRLHFRDVCVCFVLQSNAGGQRRSHSGGGLSDAASLIQTMTLFSTTSPLACFFTKFRNARNLDESSCRKLVSDDRFSLIMGTANWTQIADQASIKKMISMNQNSIYVSTSQFCPTITDDL